MDIDKIKEIWKEEDKHIIETVKVNNHASFQKLRSSLDKVRTRRLFILLQSCIALPLIFLLAVFPNLKNDGTIGFYFWVAGFVVPVLTGFVAVVYYFFRLLKVDFTLSLVKAQREIIRLQLFEKKLNAIGLLVAPFVAFSSFKMYGISLNLPMTLFFILLSLLMVVGYVVKLKCFIPREFDEVLSLLDEIEKEEEKTDQN